MQSAAGACSLACAYTTVDGFKIVVFDEAYPVIAMSNAVNCKYLLL